MIRGSISQVKMFEMFAHTQMWLWTRRNLNICKCNKYKRGYKCPSCNHKMTAKDYCKCNRFTPREELENVQGVLRRAPWGYEYIFPKEHLNEVLTIFGVKAAARHWVPGIKEAVIRKMMGNGVKKLPKFEEVPTNRYIELRGIALYPIGIKYDEERDQKVFGYNQELL